jgi:pimeloyl-ACP methyl ester carboxylesterase
MTSAIDTGLLSRPERPALAWRQTQGEGPTIVFLPGYASDMTGSKAQALCDWAQAHGRTCLLFDYAGCGASEGRFEDETIETWRDDALAVIAARAPIGPLILVGSSMGGWLMLLVALAIPDWVTGLIGIAAAPDFTDWGYTAEQKAILVRDRRLYEDSPYGPEPTLTTLALWQSGQRNLLLGAPVALDCPVRLLHGQADSDVPFDISLRLAEAIGSADVQTVFVKDGDHRLSRPEGIALLIAMVRDIFHRHSREGGESDTALANPSPAVSARHAGDGFPPSRE